MEFIDLLTVYGFNASKLAEYLGITTSAFSKKIKGTGGRGFSKEEQLLIFFLFEKLKEDLQAPIQFTKTEFGSPEASKRSELIREKIWIEMDSLSLALEIKKRRGRRKLSELEDKPEAISQHKQEVDRENES